MCEGREKEMGEGSGSCGGVAQFLGWQRNYFANLICSIDPFAPNLLGRRKPPPSLPNKNSVSGKKESSPNHNLIPATCDTDPSSIPQ